jgi:hypothetical protein
MAVKKNPKIISKQLRSSLRSAKLTRSMRGKFDRISGNLYTFAYNSATATDPMPLIIAMKSNSGATRLWKAKNGKSYMSGINIGNLSPALQSYLIKKISTFRVVNYSLISRISWVFKVNYRNYNFGKVQNLTLIDKDIYLETLSPGAEDDITEAEDLSFDDYLMMYFDNKQTVDRDRV